MENIDSIVLKEINPMSLDETTEVIMVGNRVVSVPIDVANNLRRYVFPTKPTGIPITPDLAVNYGVDMQALLMAGISPWDFSSRGNRAKARLLLQTMSSASGSNLSFGP